MKVAVELVSLRTDPTPYKAFAPEFKTLEDHPIMVEVEIQDKYVVGQTSDYTVLSAKGLALLMSTLADAMQLEFSGFTTKG